MLRRLAILIFVILAGLTVIRGASAAPNADFKLNADARGGACLKCHTDFAETLSRAHVHPLVKAKNCTGCHQPHASSHEGLLAAAPAKLCIECHADVLPKDSHSAHRSVIEGNCQQCHDPHGSAFPSILVKQGNQLCFECHGDIAETAENARFKHKPVTSEGGCLSCHRPHAAESMDFLLKADPPALCRNCHRTDTAGFKQKHMNYPVDDSRCSECHSPHGSNRRGILYETAHAPMVENDCTACHNPPDEAPPTEVKARGIELCRQCHERWIDLETGKRRVHWPMLSNDGCATCHNPHASRHKQLLRGSTETVCGGCHGDTVELQALSKKTLKEKKLCKPVQDGECATCHSPHGADDTLLFRGATAIELCARCHEWESHSSHPIGPKVIDPRNPNLSLDCLSCHRGCGTSNNPVMFQFPTTYDLCVACHVERRR